MATSYSTVGIIVFLVAQVTWSHSPPCSSVDEDDSCKRESGAALHQVALQHGRTHRHLETASGDLEEVEIEEGLWGTWKPWNGAAPGYYACGAKVQSEEKQGNGDDTAGNGLQLMYCHFLDWRLQTWKGEKGPWGEWKDEVKCPFNKWISNIWVRVEGNQGKGDDTAINGVNITCSTKSFTEQEQLTVYQGHWGRWKSRQVPQKFVKDFKIRFETPQGNGDDTAWNGLKLKMETPNAGTSFAEVVGQWHQVFSHSGPFERETSVSIERSDSLSKTTETSKEMSIAITASIEGSFKMVGASTSVQLGYSVGSRVAKAVSSSFTHTSEEEHTLSCGCGEWCYVVLWQWKMEQKADSVGAGFTLLSDAYMCTRGPIPRCPPGYCEAGDKDCQTCRFGMEPVK